MARNYCARWLFVLLDSTWHRQSGRNSPRGPSWLNHQHTPTARRPPPQPNKTRRGGIYCPSRPNGFADKGKIRSQFHHVIDVAKTILEAAGLPESTVVKSITQAPLEGVSMLPALRDADAPEHHDVQYFEILGNRGIYHKGWTAVTKHRTPWTTEAPPAFDDDVWELYGPDDWTQAHDLVKENPQKLADMQRLWLIEAVKYNVVPLDDRTFERFNPDMAWRPQLIRGNS
jgi:arylsulfatase A-like enzyme